ncbi:hypothetical protein PS943_04356 [Pseudomonas fluorescens]|uniref:Uncharacterized protein n=1 Tax=Pseudomonas fluorescens TaxID=294 RepID=A0A5E7WKY8_PSEFL|nr:hypothetical protein PS943_04356 [Pseudomonas fluorescens]
MHFWHAGLAEKNKSSTSIDKTKQRLEGNVTWQHFFQCFSEGSGYGVV